MKKLIALIAAFLICATAQAAPKESGDWWHPHPGYQRGPFNIPAISTHRSNVQAYDIDLFDTSDATISDLHAKGKKVICYFSAGSYEEAGDRMQKSFPPSVLGKPMTGWKGEKWLDIRQIKLLKPIMEARIKMAKDKGCDAIDPDNIEGFDNPSGFPISEGDQIAYNKMLAASLATVWVWPSPSRMMWGRSKNWSR